MNVHLLAGDCELLLPSLPSASVDLVLTDPPYGIAYRPRRAAADARHPWRHLIGDDHFDASFYARWLAEAYRVLRPNRHLYIFCADYHLGTVRNLVATSGFQLKRTLVWEKNAWTLGDTRGDYGHQTEFIIFAHKGRRELARPRSSNVLHFPKVPAARLLHPTEKPVELLRLLIRKSLPERGIILDPFGGSGSTAVAASLEGHATILIECDPQYAEVARRRLGLAAAAASAPRLAA